MRVQSLDKFGIFGYFHRITPISGLRCHNPTEDRMSTKRTVTSHETAIRNFPLTDVLTVVTTCSLSANGFDEMDELVEHKAELLRQHPQLQEVETAALKPSSWQKWLAAQHSTLGVQELTVRSIKMSAKKLGIMAN